MKTTKQVKEILQNAKFTAKWRNCGSWQKEGFTNALEFCEQKRVKISKKNGFYQIKMSIAGNGYLFQKDILLSDLERIIYKFIYIYLVSLGDTAKLSTRFGNYNIN